MLKTPVISVCLGVRDTQASVGFFKKLGFTALPGGGDPDDDLRTLLFNGEFALTVYRDEHLRRWMPPLRDTPVGAFATFSLAVDDFDAYVAGIRPLVEVAREHEYENQKLFYFFDPDGHVFGVIQKRP
ncbi:VOC family protein [Streptomyces sp. YIM 98790]|uniref:VOC family protein n=1 Tax=Streptomyces sp. YIM 98790 TaxID=2689077 RepID=UPI001FB6C40B|nr:VOC family protein [Streptomyces sp. YIM 98790]